MYKELCASGPPSSSPPLPPPLEFIPISWKLQWSASLHLRTHTHQNLLCLRIYLKFQYRHVCVENGDQEKVALRFSTVPHAAMDYPSVGMSMLFPFQSHIPITPPPDMPTCTHEPTSPYASRSFPWGGHEAASPTMQDKKPAQPPPPESPQRPPPPSPRPQAPHPSHSAAGPVPPKGAAHPGDPAAAAAAAAGGAAPTLDPRYVAMASRIASYYQQRCQAVATLQQQRCRAWANAQRQRCQEMVQAASVVVAWYVRDRITRRRRRRKRAFRRALAQRSSPSYPGAAAGRDGRISKGEAVRRWVMGVPEGGGDGDGGAAAEVPADKEEAEFDIDREPPPDQDSQLLEVANNLIKSHLARFDVPLLGLLSFDESESETESEMESDAVDYGAEGGNEDAEDELEDEEEAGGELAGDDGRGRRPGGQNVGTGSTSKDTLPGTPKRSRKRSRSLVSRGDVVGW